MSIARVKKFQDWQQQLMLNKVHTKATTTATRTGVPGRQILITEILINALTDAVIQIKSGATVLWEFDLTAAQGVTHIELSNCPMTCAIGADAIIAASSGTAKINFTSILG
jgi:hypothetical protein